MQDLGIISRVAFTADAPARREVSVKVGWDENGDGDTVDEGEFVVLTTEIAWVDPVDSALHATQQVPSPVSTPSPRQDASEDVASEDVIGTDLIITGDGIFTGVAGTDASLEVTIPPSDPDPGTLLNVHQVASGSHYYTAVEDNLPTIEAGVIAVFLCDNGKCSHVQNHFGGVVHFVMGTVYTTQSLSDIKVAWSSSDVNACYNGPKDTTGDPYNTMAYECVYAGNCDATDPGTRTATGPFATETGCFADSVVSDADIKLRNVGPGGEFGALGLLGVDDKVKGEQVCFLEDTVDPSDTLLDYTSGGVSNEDYLLPVTKRDYVTRGFDSDRENQQHSQGINRSYRNHNFLFDARAKGPNPNRHCHDIVTGFTYPALSAATSSSLSIAPRDIVRVLNVGEVNVVELSTAFPSTTGTAITYRGVSSKAEKNHRMYIPEKGVCFVNKKTGLDYICVGPTAGLFAAAATTPIIYGVSDETPPNFPGLFMDNEATGTYDWSGGFAP